MNRLVRPLIILAVCLCAVLAAVGIAVYIFARGDAAGSAGPSIVAPVSSSTADQASLSSAPSMAEASDTPGVLAAYLAGSPASSTVDVSSWHIYNNDSLGYFIQYPPDLLVNASGDSVSFVFPPNSYFHWPLLDDAQVTITASPACPDIASSAPLPGTEGAPSQSDIGSLAFTRHAGIDAAAGSLYTEIAYDTTEGGTCYHLDFSDHGTDGAGFYVDDQSLIARYDAQHSADLAAALQAFDAMVGSFREKDMVH